MKDQLETTVNASTKEELQKQPAKQKTSSDRKDKGTDEAANNYANKLRSTVARAAWAVARDTGSIHVSMQKV